MLSPWPFLSSSSAPRLGRAMHIPVPNVTRGQPASCRPQQLNTDRLFQFPRCQCPTQPASYQLSLGGCVTLAAWHLLDLIWDLHFSTSRSNLYPPQQAARYCTTVARFSFSPSPFSPECKYMSTRTPCAVSTPYSTPYPLVSSFDLVCAYHTGMPHGSVALQNVSGSIDTRTCQTLLTP